MLENFQQQNFASCHRTQQLGFQDEFAFFVLLAGLICFVVLPADRFVALLALDVPHNVPAVVIFLSIASACLMLTTVEKRNALPC